MIGSLQLIQSSLNSVNTSAKYFGFVGATEMSVKRSHPPSAPIPMLVTLEGIVTPFRPLQKKNARFPMLVTLEGIVTLVRPLQDQNAESPMLVTLEGIVTLVRPLQYWNALFPMLVTGFPVMVAGIVTAPVAVVGQLMMET